MFALHSLTAILVGSQSGGFAKQTEQKTETEQTFGFPHTTNKDAHRLITSLHRW